MSDTDYSERFHEPEERPQHNPVHPETDPESEPKRRQPNPGRSAQDRPARRQSPGRLPRWKGPSRPRAKAASKRSKKTYSGDAPCPYPRALGTNTNTATGAVTPVTARCMRRRCPACKHVLLRRKAAHYRDLLPTLMTAVVFVTLTEGVRHATVADAVAAIRYRFRRKFLPKLRQMMAVTPWRVAQVEIDGLHVHVHALIGTALSHGDLIGAWYRSGGGIDADVQSVRPSPDDVARCAIYILKGALDIRTGPEMTSRGVGYYVPAFKEQRRAFMASAADPGIVYEPGERAGSVTRPARTRAPDRAPETGLAPGRAVSLMSGGRHALVSEYDPASRQVTVTATRVRGRGKSRRHVELAQCRTKSAGRRYLSRRDARLRQRAHLL